MDKSEVLNNDNKTSMAVRLALAETQLIKETKDFLKDHGVNLSAFEERKTKTKRSKVSIIVKNIPYNTREDEIRRLFSKYGTILKLILPPSKTLVLIEFVESINAKKAFKSLAYTKFKHVPLYLEWAPENCFHKQVHTKELGLSSSATSSATSSAFQLLTATTGTNDNNHSLNLESNDLLNTIYVQNLNFDTTEASLKKYLVK